ncbi:MAG: hypothetical protein WCP03_04095, partial [Candidatus Saccharibacteria bacterium]
EFRDTIPKFDQSLEYARLCNPRMDSIDRTDNVTKYFFAREATQYFMSGQPSLSDKNSTHSFMQNLFCK